MPRLTVIPGSQPIEVVTFDLYDTLVEMDDPRWERMARAMRAAGLDVTSDHLKRVDRAAEDFYTVENGGVPIRDRTLDEQDAFRLEYTAVYLRAAGFDVDDDIARRVRQHFADEIATSGWTYSMFPDVIETLEALQEAGVQRAVVSNADKDVTEFCLAMGFAGRMDVIVTSALVGFEKPDARTFFAALDPLGVAPSRALHIGDQALSGVVGAQAIGMHAALLDRYHRHEDDDHEGVLVVHDLPAIAEHVIAHNQRFAASRST
jgi:putative hydrolase of the HAD superfamily